MFLRRMSLYVRLEHHGIYWNGLYCFLSEKLAFGALAALWGAYWGSLYRIGWAVQGRDKGRNGGGILE